MSLLVASGIGVVGVRTGPGRRPFPRAGGRQGRPRPTGRGHDHWFRDRGDVRYVWFRVCDATATTATTSTTTSTTTAAETTTETVATDALAAAVEGAAAETATTTDTATDTTTETTAATTTADDDPDAEEYPTFVVVPMPKDEAASLRKLDDRPCYDLTTGAPRTTATTTSASHHRLGRPRHGDDDHDAGTVGDHRLTVRIHRPCGCSSGGVSRPTVRHSASQDATEERAMRVIVVGAGPTGLFTAMALARRGHGVTVVDRDAGPQHDGSWSRRGVMQFHHPHAFRAQVVEALQAELPEVW